VVVVVLQAAVTVTGVTTTITTCNAPRVLLSACPAEGIPTL